MKRCSRIVVMPNYQGIGIGMKLLNFVAAKYKSEGYRFSITTTTPSLMQGFIRQSCWALTRQGRAVSASRKSQIEIAKRIAGTNSNNRITTSWEYIMVNTSGV